MSLAKEKGGVLHGVATQRMPAQPVVEMLVCKAADLLVPTTYDEAMESTEALICQDAMASKYGESKNARTFEDTLQSRGQNEIDAKWVYAWKAGKKGMAVKSKARLVARGFKQRKARDFLETFDPTPAAPGIRLLASIGCERTWICVTMMQNKRRYNLSWEKKFS